MQVYLGKKHEAVLKQIKKLKPKRWKASHLMQDAIEEEWKKMLVFWVSQDKTEVRVTTKTGFRIGFRLSLLDSPCEGVINCDLSTWNEKGFEKVAFEEAENLFNENSDYGYEILEKHVFLPAV